MDTIKREDAIKIAEYPYIGALTKEERVALIMNVPSAEKQGEWIDYTCGSGCYCSNCEWDGDDTIDEYIIQDFDYCPNCGCRMKGVDNDNSEM